MQIDEAKARYAREREKRLREDGLGQYQELGDYDLDRDPWADPASPGIPSSSRPRS